MSDTTVTKYKASSDDLPEIFETCDLVATAKARIYAQARVLSIEVSPDELQKFALLLVAIEQD
jgi:hypothetical protein